MTSELKEIIHQSILNYLHLNGFPKTLKRFQSEAQIQNAIWKASTVNLEDIYCKYINAASRENENNVVVETETKAKKKKKSKHETEETKSDAPKKVIDDDTDTLSGLEVNESKKKPKDKKKKTMQQDQQEVCPKENGVVDPDVVKEEKKSSKKRKRLLSDENGNQSDMKETNEEVVEEAAKEDEIDVHGKEKPEINGREISGKKQRIGSAEPKTVNAFQRVKIDQVEFAHEKLQDNSYWAKDGADVGYGAKAQEVLGQVRGRDFRHEKTKKKRGSYRGGQIDLQSHSIKFDYSDEE